MDDVGPFADMSGGISILQVGDARRVLFHCRWCWACLGTLRDVQQLENHWQPVEETSYVQGTRGRHNTRSSTLQAHVRPRPISLQFNTTRSYWRRFLHPLFVGESEGGGCSARAAMHSEELDMDNLIASTQRARDQVTSYFPGADDCVVTIGVVLIVLHRLRRVDMGSKEQVQVLHAIESGRCL